MAAENAEVVIDVRDLVVEFGAVKAVSGVSFTLHKGETLGLVGESGCGKSTTARAIMQLPPPTRGAVKLHDQDLTQLSSAEMRPLRRQLQMIFQDPISSLNPRRTVLEIVAEPLKIVGMKDAGARRIMVTEILERVGLDPELALGRRPHEFSGGQCQRISIARALVLQPEILVCDEPVSALDVSVQAQILNLLQDMKDSLDLTMLFISHDLAVIKNVSDRVAVMYLGKICEIAPSRELYSRPAHPYTVALLSAVPNPDPTAELKSINLMSGELPSPTNPPSGCRFRTRCPHALALCAEQEPEVKTLKPGHQIACHFPLE